MAWQDVLGSFDFWDNGDTWGDGRLTSFSADELNFVINSLYNFYHGSQTARDFLDALAAKGSIHIGRTSSGSFTSLPLSSSFGPDYVGFNPDEQIPSARKEV